MSVRVPVVLLFASLGIAGPARADEPGGFSAFAASTAPGADTAAQARALLDRFRAEPDVRAVQDAAVRYAGIRAARLSSWRRRARTAAAAPELLAEYRRASGTDRTLGAQSSGTVDYSDLGLEDRYTARASWKLDRLVFNPDELRVAAETLEIVELRQAVVDQVTRLYFERRRQQVELLRTALELEDRLRRELRVQELTASLDGLTGGWFSRRLEDATGPDANGGGEAARGGSWGGARREPAGQDGAWGDAGRGPVDREGTWGGTSRTPAERDGGWRSERDEAFPRDEIGRGR